MHMHGRVRYTHYISLCDTGLRIGLQFQHCTRYLDTRNATCTVRPRW